MAAALALGFEGLSPMDATRSTVTLPLFAGIGANANPEDGERDDADDAGNEWPHGTTGREQPP